jgi:hypothetical protein
MPISGSAYPFTAMLIAGAPSEAGVYALWENAELIYIGRALGGRSTIRGRLVDHFSGADGPWTQRATHYRWELCPQPEARELELLQEYEARFHRLPRCNRGAAR